MAETSETPREFADRIGPKIRPCDLNSNMAKSHIANELADRDASIASAARREERARIVKRLRDKAQELGELAVSFLDKDCIEATSLKADANHTVYLAAFIESEAT